MNQYKENGLQYYKTRVITRISRIYTHVKLRVNIDVRINTQYNITMIRKGDTKDAINTQRDDQAS